MDLRFWRNPETGLPHIYDHDVTKDLRVAGKKTEGLSPGKKEKGTMRKQRMPQGWTEEQIRALAEYHDNLTVEEQVAEIEAALADEEQTVMVVPTELVADIVKLIKRSARLELAGGNDLVDVGRQGHAADGGDKGDDASPG